jgi:hypothetical protein
MGKRKLEVFFSINELNAEDTFVAIACCGEQRIKDAVKTQSQIDSIIQENDFELESSMRDLRKTLMKNPTSKTVQIVSNALNKLVPLFKAKFSQLEELNRLLK